MTDKEKQPEEEKQHNERKKRKGKPRRGRGEGGLYYSETRKEWVGSFYTEDGKRKYVYGKKRSEAYGKLQKAQREYEQGLLVARSNQTVKQYLEHWLEKVHRHTLRLNSYVGYRSYLNNHILPALGQMKLERLSIHDVQDLYDRKLGEGLSAKTIRSIHGLLHKALKNAVRQGLLAKNVCDAVTPPRITKHETQPLTVEQAQKLLEAARGHRLEVLLTVALVTGMRRGEILGLKWQDVDFDTMTVQVCRTVSRGVGGRGYLESPPKTAAGRRKITLPQFLVEMLQRHRELQQEVRLRAGEAWQEHDLLFCNRSGEYLRPDRMAETFHKLLQEAGLPRIRFHDLRHSAATILLSMGVNPKVIQELLGHSQITITLGIYSHVLPTMQKDAMDKWSGLFGRDSGK